MPPKARDMVRNGKALEKVNHMESLMHREMRPLPNPSSHLSPNANSNGRLLALKKLRADEIKAMQERARCMSPCLGSRRLDPEL